MVDPALIFFDASFGITWVVCKGAETGMGSGGGEPIAINGVISYSFDNPDILYRIHRS